MLVTVSFLSMNRMVGTDSTRSLIPHNRMGTRWNASLPRGSRSQSVFAETRRLSMSRFFGAAYRRSFLMIAALASSPECRNFVLPFRPTTLNIATWQTTKHSVFCPR